MGHLTEDPSVHDLFLGTIVRSIMNELGTGKLLAFDGGTPFREQAVESCMSLDGYRPDAILESCYGIHLVEVKSYTDLFSAHTKQQFEIARRLLERPEFAFMHLFVFGVPANEEFDLSKFFGEAAKVAVHTTTLVIEEAR